MSCSPFSKPFSSTFSYLVTMASLDVPTPLVSRLDVLRLSEDVETAAPLIGAIEPVMSIFVRLDRTMNMALHCPSILPH